MSNSSQFDALRAEDIIYEDNHLLVINKRPGLLAQSDVSGDPDALTLGKDYIGRKYNKPGAVFLGLVHRLDRAVGGVMILARTSKAAGRLSAAVREQRIRKMYRALCMGPRKIPDGELVDRVRKDERTRMAVADVDSEAGREARLILRSLEPAPAQLGRVTAHDASPEFTYVGCLYEIELITGRFHQIRYQLSSRGMPIVGDVKYGSQHALPGVQLALFCTGLQLEHPVRREPLSLTAPLPDWAQTDREARQ
ncbi:MAG: RluA family pseudouridine synthase [Leptospiraceae bacterium]|nr:RluA family pseudouridine synthase [Leptospiraceae bacterium]